MLDPAKDPNDISKFARLDAVEVATATPSSDFIVNVKINTKKGHKKLSDLPGFAQIKGHHNPIALIGGGPSIKKEIDRIKDFQAAGFPTIACGSSHDWLVENGVIPTYCAVCDPDPLVCEYLKRHSEHTKYLVALSCDVSVYDFLKGRDIYVWNCKSDEAAPHIVEEVAGHVEILGGCTVGLRSVSIVMCFGYTNLHFWGFDSCMGSGDEHHAYEYATDREETGVTYPIRFGDTSSNTPEEGGKYYICSGYQLAQAVHFQQFLAAFGSGFTPTFHGEGMLTDYIAFLRKKAANKPNGQQVIQNGL